MQSLFNRVLELTVKFFGRGVVVHVETQKDLEENIALQNMENMIKEELNDFIEKYTLLLERGCGEEKKMLMKIKKFGYFFYRFNEEERQKTFISIETCHIFSSAYDTKECIKH